MPFKCSLCELDIRVGEPMLSDEKMNLAHEACVRRGRAIDPPTTIDVTTKISGSGFGNPTAVVSPAVPIHEPCLLPSAPKVCIECKKSAISMCPSCNEYVHQDYGYNGANCSGRHEGRCEGARQSRSPKKKAAEQTIADVVGMIQVGAGVFLTSKNGEAKPKKRKGRR
jgi:hypothetical protein